MLVELNTAQCPYCGRTVRTDKGRFGRHALTAGSWGNTCPLQLEYVPITGLTADAHDRRAELIGHLAWRMKDEDPAAVWRYLTVLPADELQRLLMIALAAIPVDRSMDELFAWVEALPDARFEKAAQ